MKQNYQAIWTSFHGIDRANVSFSASSPAGIIRQVKQIARQIGYRSDTCQVFQRGNLIMQDIK